MNEKTDEMKLLVKENLELFIPSLFKLLNGQNISWKGINKKFVEKHFERKEKYDKNDKYLLVPVNFYDVVTGVMNENPGFTRLLGYFEYVFDELNRNLDGKEKLLVSKTLRNLLNDFTSDYIHYIGELSVLNVLTRSKLLTLDKMEFTLDNGKNMDFRLFCGETNQYLLVEIMNLHIDKENSKEVDVFEKFLQSKILNKIEDKTNGSSINDFTLIPVLWGGHHDLHKIYDFYKKGFKNKNDKVFEPFSYLSWYDTEGTLYKFQNISKIFDPVGGIIVK